MSKSPPKLTNTELVAYANKIILAQPIDYPGEHGGGGDGPENVVAVTAALLESLILQTIFYALSSQTTFLINCLSGEAKAQREWLTKKEFEDLDIFSILNEVIESLNITFVPVLYGSGQRRIWYQQAIVMTEG